MVPNAYGTLSAAFCLLLSAVCLLFLAACTPGPKYARPSAPMAPAYKELAPSITTPQGAWQPSQPQDQAIRGKWWGIFNDPHLNALEERVEVSNQNLKIAEAEYRQARDLIQINRSYLYPTIGVGPNITGEQFSKNAPNPPGKAGQTQGDFVLPFDLSYEIDAWGRIRRTIEATKESAQASSADLETARLSIHAELAADYFALRGLDAQKQLLDETVVAYQRALELTTNRYNGGLAAKVEVAQAETQLETTQAQDIDLGVARAQYEHAIAALVGQTGVYVLDSRYAAECTAASDPRRSSFGVVAAPAGYRRGRAAGGGRQRPDRHRHDGLLPHAHAERRRGHGREFDYQLVCLA